MIINISSISRAGNVGQTNYFAAKAGVSAMTVTWAKELARYNIRVVGIAPGFCETRMVKKIPPKILDSIISAIPLHGSPLRRRSGVRRCLFCRTITARVVFWRSMVDCGCDRRNPAYCRFSHYDLDLSM